MAGIVILGCPFVTGLIVGPCIDLTLLGTSTTSFRDIGITHGWAIVACIGISVCYAIYRWLFPVEPSAETALNGAWCYALVALLIGYIISIVITAIIWNIWQAAN